MKKLAIVALPGLLIMGAATGFLSTLTRNNASHQIQEATREASPPPAASRAVPNQPTSGAAAAEATKQPAPSSISPFPASLAESVTANFPGYRLPGPADIKETWAANDAGRMPVLAEGDFNGDGRTDAALIILGKSDWRLVIFEQDDQQHYAPAAVFRAKTIEEVPSHSADSVIAVPQHLVLKTMKQGETWVQETDEGMEVKLKFDGIPLSWRPKPNYHIQSLIYFDDGKYQTRGYDSLLQIR